MVIKVCTGPIVIAAGVAFANTVVAVAGAIIAAKREPGERFISHKATVITAATYGATID